MKAIVDHFKKNTKNVSFYIEIKDDEYFNFLRKYKKITGDFIFNSSKIKKQQFKWKTRARISFNPKNKKFIEKMEQYGYNLKKDGNRYCISNMELFWKLVESGYRIPDDFKIKEED